MYTISFPQPDSISLAICERRMLKLESSNHVCLIFKNLICYFKVAQLDFFGGIPPKFEH